MTPLAFSLLRRLSPSEFRSGEVLAAELGVSRATICNVVAQLSRQGIGIYRLPGRGYRLARSLDWLDAPRLAAQVGDRFLLHVLEVTDSTNTTLMRWAAEGAPHRSCLVAELQTAGRGRRGRRWESVLGGSLTFSVLWRFPQGVAQLSGLSLAVGLALYRAMVALGVREAALKWPNDLLHRHRKMGGILVELQGDALGPAAAIIGVGINVWLGEARARIDQAVTDLATVLGEAPSRNEALATVLRHLDEVLSLFEAQGFAPLRAEWEAVHAYHGRHVALSLPSGQVVQGVVAGVGEEGALLVQTMRGVERFGSGEISLRPAKFAPA
jgi:BirA family biotin operon repressor/biotin-[acetyl-CoA-carboxylase] ligase